MRATKKKGRNLKRRRLRVRRRLAGTPERPRLTVFRSLKHMYAQVVDDTTGKTLVAATTLRKALLPAGEKTGNISAATAVGKAVAEAEAVAREAEQKAETKPKRKGKGKPKQPVAEAEPEPEEVAEPEEAKEPVAVG